MVTRFRHTSHRDTDKIAPTFDADTEPPSKRRIVMTMMLGHEPTGIPKCDRSKSQPGLGHAMYLSHDMHTSSAYSGASGSG